MQGTQCKKCIANAIRNVNCYMIGVIMDKWDVYYEMLEYMSGEELAYRLVAAMSTNEAMENFEYIDSCHDLGIFNEDEDED